MKQTLVAIKMLLIMTVLTGIIYPLLITGFAQILYSDRASGQLLKKGDAIIGSHLIGQKFENDKYFWSRPSANDYNAGASGASNLGQASSDLKKAYEERKSKLNASHTNAGNPPQDMLFASSSGLDPHITPEAAHYQSQRVATARGIEMQHVQRLIEEMTEGRQLGILGEPRVNVLALNMKLDEVSTTANQGK